MGYRQYFDDSFASWSGVGHFFLGRRRRGKVCSLWHIQSSYCQNSFWSMLVHCRAPISEAYFVPKYFQCVCGYLATVRATPVYYHMKTRSGNLQNIHRRVIYALNEIPKLTKSSHYFLNWYDVFFGWGKREGEDMCHNNIPGRVIYLEPFVYCRYII